MYLSDGESGASDVPVVVIIILAHTLNSRILIHIPPTNICRRIKPTHECQRTTHRRRLISGHNLDQAIIQNMLRLILGELVDTVDRGDVVLLPIDVSSSNSSPSEESLCNSNGGKTLEIARGRGGCRRVGDGSFTRDSEDDSTPYRLWCSFGEDERKCMKEEEAEKLYDVAYECHVADL